MNREQLNKSIELTKEYNDELHKKLRTIKKIMDGKSKTQSEVKVEQLQEILILISILLSGNIKVRYELEDFIRNNKAFIDLATIKSISTNCKLDIDSLKAQSFAMVEVLKSMKLKQDEEAYKEAVI